MLPSFDQMFMKVRSEKRERHLCFFFSWTTALPLFLHWQRTDKLLTWLMLVIVSYLTTCCFTLYLLSVLFLIRGWTFFKKLLILEWVTCRFSNFTSHYLTCCSVFSHRWLFDRGRLRLRFSLGAGLSSAAAGEPSWGLRLENRSFFWKILFVSVWVFTKESRKFSQSAWYLRSSLKFFYR